MKIKDMSSMLKIDHGNYQTSFEKIAQNIFNTVKLNINGELFLPIEIEFYYYSEHHKDMKTLKRTSKVGDLFFHDYGIDLCFESDGKNQYGGILLRSIKSIADENFINGPLKVTQAIMNKIKVNESFIISYDQSDLQSRSLTKYKRIISANTDNHYIEKPYRFAIEIDNPKNKVKYKTKTLK